MKMELHCGRTFAPLAKLATSRAINGNLPARGVWGGIGMIRARGA
jgi:hypothetical protein